MEEHTGITCDLAFSVPLFESKLSTEHKPGGVYGLQIHS